MQYIVCYDIADDQRRERLSELLLNYGSRIQRSVFLLHLDNELAGRMRRDVERVLEPVEDVAHIFPMCGDCEPKALVVGAGVLPKDAEYYIL